MHFQWIAISGLFQKNPQIQDNYFAEYFLCAIFSDSKGYGLIIAVLSVVVTYATAWIKKKYFICRLVGKLKPVE